MPPTAQAPASAKPREDPIKSGGHTNRGRVAIQAVIESRENQGEENCRHDKAEHDQSAKDEGEKKNVRHRAPDRVTLLRHPPVAQQHSFVR